MKLKEWANIMPCEAKVVPLTVGDDSSDWKENTWDLSRLLEDHPELEDREISEITFPPYNRDVFLIWLDPVEPVLDIPGFRGALDALDHMTDAIKL